jgi:GTPase
MHSGCVPARAEGGCYDKRIMPDAISTVVIVGRPNVGKSTLFNRITGQRRAITTDEPGITRDRIHGQAVHQGRKFELIDTGGILVHEAELFSAQILSQAETALRKAAHVILVVDGRAGVTGADRDLAQMLRRMGRPLSIAVNKVDSGALEGLANEFHELGAAALFPVSAEHGLGVDAMLDHVTEGFPEAEPETEEPRETIKVAIIGRPNVGKSTLLNALTGQERAIVSPVPGTTRDAVDETVTYDGIDYVFIDTAGIRRKGKTKLLAEKLSVVMARRHIRMAHVVLLVLDATEGVLGPDATIAGYAHEGGRATVICVNKWDQMKGTAKTKFEQDIRDAFKFMDYATVAFLSAKSGAGVGALFGLVHKAYESASRRITTGELNRFVATVPFEERKIYYITQKSVRPPSFIAFTDKRSALHFSHQRYIINQIRKRFGFEGTPIELGTRAKGSSRAE